MALGLSLAAIPTSAQQAATDLWDGNWLAPESCNYTPTDICPPGEECTTVGCTAVTSLSMLAEPCPNPHTGYSGCDYGGVIYCRDPELAGVAYSVAPGCDPFGGANCSITAQAQVRFRANNQNVNPGGSYSPAVAILRSSGGAVVGVCGTPGGPMRSDEATITIHREARCSDGASLTMSLEAQSCSCPEGPFCAWNACWRSKTETLDFSTALGCEQPPFFGCSDSQGAAAGSCCLGPMGAAPPVGGGSSLARSSGETPEGTGPEPPRIGAGFLLPQSGPRGFAMAYQEGGVGSPGFPENPAWYGWAGRYWNHSYAVRLVPDPDETRVWLVTEAGTFRRFENPDLDGIYHSTLPADEYRALEWLGAGMGWALHQHDGSMIFFGADGLWDRTVDRNGKTTQGTYDGLGRLVAVALPDERALTLQYNDSLTPGNGKLFRVIENPVPGSGGTPRTWTFTWVNDGVLLPRLSRIDRPGGSRWRFGYDGAAIPHLTRIYLEGPGGSPSRIEAAWEYDASGNLIHAWKGSESFASGVDRFEWSYVSETETRVTDAYGMETIYTFERDAASGKPRVLSVVGGCPTCGLDPSSTLDYDNPANPGHPLLPWKITNGEGVTTEMTYTDFGKVATRTEAMNTILSRTTSWSYDSSYPAFTTLRTVSSAVPGCPVARETAWSYDAANGNLLDRTESGCEIVDGLLTSYSLETAFDYGQTTAGEPSGIDPPGFGSPGFHPDEDDVTILDWDESRGDQVLLSRTQALLGTGSYGYDGFNRRTSTTDANGVVTTTEYDLLERVTAVTRVGDGGPTPDERTELFYTQLGDLYCVRYPEGNGVLYEYETDTGRLLRTTWGTAIAGTPSPPATCLDASQPRERLVQTFEPYGRVLTAQRERCAGTGCTWIVDATESRSYSSRCHLDKTTLAPAAAEEAVTEYGYDCSGRLAAVWDANHEKPLPPSTTYRYDALDRLTATVQGWEPSGAACDTEADDPLDADCSIVAYGYDIQDHLTSVVDGEGSETTYSYSDRDLMTAQVSNVSGTTSYEYNEHGELVEEIDARGDVVTRAVDGADRPTSVDYGGDPALLTTYSYGSTPSAFDYGKLVGITRDGETIAYGYDRFGRLTTDGALGLTYDKNGRRETISYPGGVTASYTFDFADREASLSVDDGSGPLGVASGALYAAGGPLRRLSLGTLPPRLETRSFDLRLQPATIGVDGGLLAWAYTLDGVGNVTAISQSQPSAESRSFEYLDFQYFLARGTGPWGLRSWTYDRIGNRLTEQVPFGGEAYAYVQNGTGGNTPLLSAIYLLQGGLVRKDTHDPAGNLDYVLRGANELDLGWSEEGRLESVLRQTDKHSAAFEYDGRSFLRWTAHLDSKGLAVGSPLQPTYDSSGILRTLTEADAGERRHVFYLAGRPVALLEQSGSSRWTFLTTDHLGTPIHAMDSSGTTTWLGGFEPFGRDWQTGASSATAAGVFLRLPGQWIDPIWEPPTLGIELYYNVHRWYEPQTGRYTQPDPLGLRGSAALQLFGYAESNPLSWSDPFGLCSCRDECQSGKWNYLGLNFQWAFLGGFSFTRGEFACQGQPEVRQKVWSGCGVVGFYIGGGAGYEQSTGAVPTGCGCNPQGPPGPLDQRCWLGRSRTGKREPSQARWRLHANGNRRRGAVRRRWRGGRDL